MTAGLEDLLQYENAFDIIDRAQGINKIVDQSGWSEKGCRALARAATKSFQAPAQACLEKIQDLLV